METPHQRDWDSYWSHQQSQSLFGRICELHRKIFISRFVRSTIEKYFPPMGIFVEAGSGTSQSSSRIIHHHRTLIGIDLSFLALQQARNEKTLHAHLCGNILSLPLQTESIDGIWNLGVMEHFTSEQITTILHEFHRVLKKNSYVLLFWPSIIGSSQLLLGTIEKIHNLFSSKKLQFFPDELNVLTSRRHLHDLLQSTPLELTNIHFSPRDLFTYHLIVLRKE